MKKRATKYVDSLLKLFLNLKKSQWEHYLSKKLYNFKNKFLYFKVATTKFS